ncbi:acetylglutamate kinase [Allobaculum mucilyticum]|uniref:acetylglutamate kinase n=1 Tax=Allobaculum mucilyticum TaxID=2834459 RepID=UPI001E2A1A94|nr:acetylglutamate kinase [Allobaculum mucilyticum]UNT97082.1 acetylglutamate kinase [Allobaculum mucilyticum]
MNAKQRAAILAEALPYLKEYHGEIVVVKYGGNAMIDEELKKAVIEDVLMLHLVGINVVLVHGGGPEISRMLKKTGIESHFVNGLRYTDEQTMDIVQMVLCGKVNKDLVSLLEGKGVGLGGMDGGLFQAVRLEDEETEYGYVGEIRKVNCGIVKDMIEKGYIPVISSVGAGLEDLHTYNINADTAASRLAGALHAKKLILLTDIAGLLENPDDPDSLIASIKVSQVPAMLATGAVSGGMIPKVDCCVEAVRQGVERASIIDGRIPHSILIELLTNEGIGTMFSQEEL